MLIWVVFVCGVCQSECVEERPTIDVCEKNGAEKALVSLRRLETRRESSSATRYAGPGEGHIPGKTLRDIPGKKINRLVYHTFVRRLEIYRVDL